MEIVINTYGTKISLREGMIVIKNEMAEKEVPMKLIDSIHLGKGCSLSSDVIYCAVENNIDITFGSRTGKPVGRVWGVNFGSVSSIRKQQLTFTLSGEAAGFIAEILAKKIQNQQSVLLLFHTPGKRSDKTIDEASMFLEKYIQRFNNVKEGNIEELADTFRGWEGYCSKKFFETINQNIPEQYRFEKRSKHPATDMFNSLLNYCYGILYSKIEIALIRAGIDPYIGIFHRDEYNRPVLVYDVIEMFRYWAEIVVIRLCMQQIIFPEFFDFENDAVYLNNDGKRILIQCFNDYLDEVIPLNGLERTRKHHIEQYAWWLARKFKEFDNQ